MQSVLSSLSHDLQEQLVGLYESIYNRSTPLLSGEQLRQIRHSKDHIDLLLRGAVLSLGLLHADSASPEVQLQKSSGTRRSKLHQALKEIVENEDVAKFGIRALPVFIMLSELERSIACPGAANTYLREAQCLLTNGEIAENNDQSDLNTSLDQCANVCEFLMMQWRFYGHNGSLSLPHQGERGRQNKKSGKQREGFEVHLELFHVFEEARGKPTAEAVQLLESWQKALPHALRWSTRNAGWPISNYLLHMQYQAILTRIDPSKGEALVAALEDFNKNIGLDKAPLILAHQAKMAGDALLCKHDNDQASSHPLALKRRVNDLVQTLETLSSRYPVATAMCDKLRPKTDALQWEDQQALHQPTDTIPMLFNIDYGNLDFTNLHAPAFDATDFAEPLHDTHLWAGVDTQQAQLDGQSPSSSNAQTYEETLDQISDPVFGGYMDEVAYIRGQARDPQEKRRRLSSVSQTEVDVSTETWRGNDVAEQFRAFLGHDIGIRGPSPDDFDAEVVHDIGDSLWGEQFFRPQMVA